MPTSSDALSALEHQRLAALLDAMPPTRRWEVGHMHGPLLCSLGLVEPPDDAYADAAHRLLGDPVIKRRRALSLLKELERQARTA
jgi:hypothetical protein